MGLSNLLFVSLHLGFVVCPPPLPWCGTEEVAKLQKHLALLRQEYVKMQQKLADTERRCAVLAAQTSGQGSPSPAPANTFISRLLDIVADLYQQEQYRWGSWSE